MLGVQHVNMKMGDERIYSFPRLIKPKKIKYLVIMLKRNKDNTILSYDVIRTGESSGKGRSKKVLQSFSYPQY